MQDIVPKVNCLRERGKIYSNFYQSLAQDESLIAKLFEDEFSVVVITTENSFFRVYFFTLNVAECFRFMGCHLPKNQSYILEIVDRDETKFAEEIGMAGFTGYTKLQRYAATDVTNNLEVQRQCLNVENAMEIAYATDCDLNETHNLLRETFDDKINHLPSLVELRDSIFQKEVLIARDKEGKICAALQFVEQPKRFYINQIVNRGSKDTIHSMMCMLLLAYVERGGKYVYAWIEDGNEASIRFHGKYGLKPDGLKTIVYHRR